MTNWRDGSDPPVYLRFSEKAKKENQGMSNRITALVFPCLMLCAWFFAFGIAAVGQEGGRGKKGGRGANISDLPDNDQSRAHIDAARKLAGDDPVLMKTWTFFCTAERCAGNQPMPAVPIHFCWVVMDPFF